MDGLIKRPHQRATSATSFGCAKLGLLAVAVLSATTIGCGSPRRVPVTGAITLDGKPVEGASVMFVPIEHGPAATGVTDAEGRYRLATINEEGAAPGEYRVSVVKADYKGAPADKGGVEDVKAFKSEGAEAESRLRVEHALPKVYSDAEKSGLKATVTAQGGSFTFSLTKPPSE